MDDIYDLRSLFLGKDSLISSLITTAVEGTPLEDSASDLSFLVGTFAVVNIVFLMLFFSQFAILWIERKAVARMNDRRGATTALRSLWVGGKRRDSRRMVEDATVRWRHCWCD